MPRPFRLALAQLNLTVGDIPGNAARMLDCLRQAQDAAADLIAFPELATTGYPPEDLLFKQSFIDANTAAMRHLIAQSRGIAVVIGCVRPVPQPPPPPGEPPTPAIANSAAIGCDGQLIDLYDKIFLPNYGVFDEARYFIKGGVCPVYEIGNARIGVNVCEDIWYETGPASSQRWHGGAQLIVNINASPFHAGKSAQRRQMIRQRAAAHQTFVAYLNTVGGQDELVFDGNSLICDPQGQTIARGPAFQEALIIADLNLDAVPPLTQTPIPPAQQAALNAIGTPKTIKIPTPHRPPQPPAASSPTPTVAPQANTAIPQTHFAIPQTHFAISQTHPAAPPTHPAAHPTPSAAPPTHPAAHPTHPAAPATHSELVEEPPEISETEEIYRALVLGTRDYLYKTGFAKAIIGLSGGIDSALTAVIAADAIGPQNVTGVTMPSRHSSPGSIQDSAQLARNLGLEFWEIPIEPAHDAFTQMLAPPFAGTTPNVAEENVQARIRGNLLMTIANKFGWIVLTTGNKSEMAMGYATLYGDMAGGFAVLKDVPKTAVYALAHWRNHNPPYTAIPSPSGGGLGWGRPPHPIPQNILTKPPSAELRENQLDADTLPPYEILDPVIQAYVENDHSYAEMVAQGHPPAVVRQVITAVDRNEYKRRQSPPGVKITPRAFGRDRRLPIVNRYRQT